MTYNMKEKLLIHYVPSSKKRFKPAISITTHKTSTSALRDSPRNFGLSNRMISISKLIAISLKNLRIPLSEEMRRNNGIPLCSSSIAKSISELYGYSPVGSCRGTSQEQAEAISSIKYPHRVIKMQKDINSFGSMEHKEKVVGNKKHVKKPFITEGLNSLAHSRMKGKGKLVNKAAKLIRVGYRRKPKAEKKAFFIVGRNPLSQPRPNTNTILKRPLSFRGYPIHEARAAREYLDTKNETVMHTNTQVTGRQIKTPSKGVSIFIPRLNKIKRDASTSTTEDNRNLCICFANS
eukprot:TRINITY_DN2633_c1_g1_i1.p1 TRINITY_DN2633_c1_g1~~TRINITY_DN2633_c1_g1_i1.p1  ORF type:complete len:292 (-),score=34.75 TRINITY_DN2633_c1_g1_i1:155-1030(-)